ncbi:peptidoglycan editing factor PgeF [Halocynthiibacter namhaensis]|uniref:peptidoglycan editing factor PgeF n=1 Tax=Halocynthiibacter namhaensis TaxID=1290553 RepID=UPI00057952CE|nr:peptidoglycan editing factor PgeF [Halocynthiibacter namhaensis]
MGLEILTDDSLLPFRHGFFTRLGGASSGIYHGLNCGFGSDDQANCVTINRARVADALLLAPENLLSVHQIHSADVLHVTGPLDKPLPQADAMVTATPGLAISALSADCQPVLFADPDAKVIGAAHAGSKGALGGVLQATIDAMETLGATRENISAVIGPCISQRAYEVGEEFAEDFIQEDPGNSRFFANGLEGKYQFDLPGFGLHTLRSAGVKQARWVGHCTYSDPTRFYSWRRACHNNEGDYGRLIASIRI